MTLIKTTKELHKLLNAQKLDCVQGYIRGDVGLYKESDNDYYVMFRIDAINSLQWENSPRSFKWKKDIAIHFDSKPTDTSIAFLKDGEFIEVAGHEKGNEGKKFFLARAFVSVEKPGPKLHVCYEDCICNMRRGAMELADQKNKEKEPRERIFVDLDDSHITSRMVGKLKTYIQQEKDADFDMQLSLAEEYNGNN